MSNLANSLNQVDFAVANNVVTHLGRNLYKTTPPALAELVANSYDAYATRVEIKVTDDMIIVADNGCGMDLESIKSKYAPIGIPKKEEKPFHEMRMRQPMGKKGIGKLAAFSLGNKYTIYSKTETMTEWGKIDLDYLQMRNSSPYVRTFQYVDKLPEVLLKTTNSFKDYTNGFIVVISDLRRRFQANTLTNLRSNLSRRFYIKESTQNFQIFLNGNKIELSKHQYYGDFQYMVYVGFSKQEMTSIFGTSVVLEEYNKNPKVNTYVKENGIKGWIGSVEQPKQLAGSKSIMVYINGKIADEDILSSNPDARLANSYIVGEFQADFLDNNNTDIITSSREGLDDSDEQVQDFKKIILLIRNMVISNWDDIRATNATERLPDRIKNNGGYKRWINDLTPNQKRINNKLIDLLSPELDEKTSIEPDSDVEQLVTSICSTVNNVDMIKLSGSLKEIERQDPNFLKLIEELMKNVAKQEDIKQSQIAQSRISAIEQLERALENPDANEKLFQQQLAKNPWLINPTWNSDSNITDEEFRLEREKYFKAIETDGEFHRRFIDLYVRVKEERYPIIVELKKNRPTGHARVDYYDIARQIDHYRNAIKRNNTEYSSINETEIPAIFISSSDSGLLGEGNTNTITDAQSRMLKDSNIKIFKYSHLISQAYRTYAQQIKVFKEKPYIPFLDDEN